MQPHEISSINYFHILFDGFLRADQCAFMTKQTDVVKFRTAIMPAAICIFLIAIPMAFIAVYIKLRYLNAGSIACGIITGVVNSFFFSWLYSVLLPVWSTDAGIYGPTIWGNRCFVSWPDVEKAKTFRLINLKWLRVYSTDGTVAWLPLFLSRDTDFRQEVQRLAPPNSPILEFLR
jgi:hypothetical protein